MKYITVFFSLILFSCSNDDSYWCVERKKIYPNEFAGRVAEFYCVNISGREYDCVRFKNKYDKILELFMLSYELEKHMQIGDSIYKSAKSIRFYVIRNGKLIYDRKEDWDCNYSTSISGESLFEASHGIVDSVCKW